MRSFYYTLLMCLMAFVGLQAQNCTINAGIPSTICPEDSMFLNGIASGLLHPTAPDITWIQVSGPSITIGSPNTLISYADIPMGGFTPGNYQFQLEATCEDDIRVSDIVNVTVANAVTEPGRKQ